MRWGGQPTADKKPVHDNLDISLFDIRTAHHQTALSCMKEFHLKRCSAFLSKQLTSQCQNRCLDLDVWYPNLFVQLNQSIDKNLSHNSSFRWNNWYFYQTVCVCICVCVLYLYFSLRLYLFYWEDSPPPPTQGNINDCSGMSPVISNAVLSRWRPLLHPHNTSYIQFQIENMHSKRSN